MHMLLISAHELYRCAKKAESQYIHTFLNKDDIVAIWQHLVRLSFDYIFNDTIVKETDNIMLC